MKLIKTELEGVFIIENFQSSDERGSFIKTYQSDFFKENDLSTEFKESYYSISKKNVIRGMHFQLPPYDHEKLVYVVKGELIDVILDIRKTSSTYGKSISIVLSESNYKSVYIPRGLAHGFKSMVDNTITIYNVSTIYNEEADFGIKFDSIGFDWSVEFPIVSNRDNSFISLEEFKNRNPF